MTEAITLPPGAFAAAKSGQPMPTPEMSKAPTAPSPEPKPKQLTKNPDAFKDIKPSESPEVAEMTPAEKKIWKLKADGEDFEFDASDEENIKREIMKARGADKRFKESASLRQQAETFFQMIKDPKKMIEVLEDPRIGHDFKKVAENYIWEKMEEERMTPEQKQQRERDRRLEEYEAREQAAKEVENKEKSKVLESHYEKKIMSALDAQGVPKTEDTVYRMATYLQKATEKGYDLSADELAQLVKTDIANEYKTYMKSLSEDQFVDFVGEHAEKLRKADLKRLKSPQGNPFPQRDRVPKRDNAAKMPKKVPASQWKEDLAKDFMLGKWKN